MAETLYTTCKWKLDSEVASRNGPNEYFVRCGEWEQFARTRLYTARKMQIGVSAAIMDASADSRRICTLLKTVQAFYRAHLTYTDQAEMLSITQIPNLVFCTRLLLLQVRSRLLSSQRDKYDDALEAFDAVFIGDYEYFDTQDMSSPWISDLLHLLDVFCCGSRRPVMPYYPNRVQGQSCEYDPILRS